MREYFSIIGDLDSSVLTNSRKCLSLASSFSNCNYIQWVCSFLLVRFLEFSPTSFILQSCIWLWINEDRSNGSCHPFLGETQGCWPSSYGTQISFFKFSTSSLVQIPTAISKKDEPYDAQSPNHQSFRLGHIWVIYVIHLAVASWYHPCRNIYLFWDYGYLISCL